MLDTHHRPPIRYLCLGTQQSEGCILQKKMRESVENRKPGCIHALGRLHQPMNSTAG